MPTPGTTRAPGSRTTTGLVLIALTGALGAQVLDAGGVHALARLPSLDELRGKLIGVLSERDIYWCESQKDVDPEVMSVAEAMKPPVAPLVCA